MKKKYDREKSNDTILNLPTVVLQFIFLVLILVFLIICIFKQGIYMIILEGLLTIEFILLAFNNYKIFKRKNFTIFYLLAAILTAAMMIDKIMKL